MVLARLGLVLVACLAFAAPADAQIKSFTVNIDRAPGDPDTPLAPGALETITATLTNNSANQQLGSSNIVVPPDYVLRAARTPQGTASVSGDTGQFRTLALRPRASVTVELDVVAPCNSGEHTWSVTAKQANDYQGLPGNDFVLAGAKSDRVTTVAANCGARTDCAEDVDCSVAVQKSNTRFDLSAFSDALPDATLLEAAFDVGARPVCAGYTPASEHHVFFNGPNRAKTGEWSVPATVRPAADLEFCFAAPYPFVGESSTTDNVPAVLLPDANGEFVGLLLDCLVAQELLTVLPPCVRERLTTSDGRSAIRMDFPDNPLDPRGTG